MNSTMKRAIGALLAGAALLAVQPDRAAAQQEVVLANGNWAPYQGKELENGGPVTQVVTEAFESQGWTVRYEWLPWARGKREAARGKLDGTQVYSRTDARAKQFIYSDKVLELKDFIFYNVDNPVDWKKPADLAGLTFGGVIDYDYDIFKRNPDVDVTLDRIGKPILNFKKLARGRIDAVISNSLVGRNLAEEAGVSEQIEAHPKPASSEPYFVMISRKAENAEQILDTFNAGLAELKSSGRYDEIMSRL